MVPFVLYGGQEGRSPGVASLMPVDADYYVMATDVVTAEEVSKSFRPSGCPAACGATTTVVYPGPNGRAE